MGKEYPTMDDFSFGYVDKTKDRLLAVFQSPRGGAANLCENAALNFEAKPNVEGGVRSILYVSEDEDGSTVFEEWKAAIIALNFDGNEIGRIVPDWSRKPEPPQMPYFSFTIGEPFANTARSATKILVLINRGYGIERYEVNKDNFPLLKTYNPD